MVITDGGVEDGGKMPGAIQELKIGPFSGGINSHSDKSAIADSEMVDCVNFDIDLDGSLLARPPFSIQFSSTMADSTTQLNAYNYIWYLGSFVYNNVRMVFYQVQNHDVDTSVSANIFVYFFDGANAGTAIQLTGMPIQRYTVAARWDNKVYIVPHPDSTLGGFSYDLTTIPATAITAIAGMPGGNATVFYKFAMWIGGGKNTNKSRIFYSALSDPTSWPAANFFDIAPGDGFAVEDMILYQDNIIVAKENSTYVLAYDSSPLNAIVRMVNNTIGVKQPRCLVSYENSIFFFQYGQVYEMVNYNFTRVSTKIFSTTQNLDQTIVDPYGFGAAWQFPLWMSTVGDRLVVRDYNTLWVYHLRVRAWTRWDSNDAFVHNMGPIMEIERSNSVASAVGYKTYVTSTSINAMIDAAGPGSGSAWHRYNKMLVFNDHYDGTTKENGQITPSYVDIASSLFTKVFDINLSQRFKRLMHWGVDVITGRTITGTLFPFSVNFLTTWGQLAPYTWNQLNTWAYPLSVRQSTSVPVSGGGIGLIRQFVRFPYSLRFRLLQFEVQMLYSGNTTDGPSRLYTVTAFIGSKQLVPNATN